MKKRGKLVVLFDAVFEVNRTKGGGFSLVYLAMVSSIHTMIATMNIKDNDPNRGVLALAIVTKCGTSMLVLIPIGIITTLLADIITFNAAVGATRKTTWKVVKNGIKAIMRTFQTAMDNDPVHADEIRASGGFGSKKVNNKQKNVFGIRQGTTSGQILAIGNTSPKTHCHDWEWSTDGINFTRVVPVCGDANYVFTFIPGKRYWIRHTLIMGKGPNGPVQTLFLDLV